MNESRRHFLGLRGTAHGIGGRNEIFHVVVGKPLAGRFSTVQLTHRGVDRLLAERGVAQIPPGRSPNHHYP